MGNFKVQGQCVISTYERMKQKDCKFEDSQGHIETAVFTPLNTSHLAYLGLLLCCIVDGAIFLLVTSCLADTGLGGHFDKSQAS